MKGFVAKEIADQRMSICKQCERFFELTSSCKECGCFMVAKVTLALGKCPLDKWLEVKDE
jgi:hypothetical protein